MLLFKQYLEEPKVSDNGWLVRFRNSWSNCSLCEESKKRSKQVFYPPETGLTGCLYSSLFSWVHPVQNTGKVLFSEKEKRCIIYKSRFVLLNSSFVFWLAIRTRQNMARLVKNIQGYNKLNWLWSIYLFGFGRRTYGNLNCDVWLIGELRVHKRVTEITGKREVQIFPKLYNV